MHKKLTVLLAAVGVLASSVVPAVASNADATVKIQTSVADVVAILPKGTYSVLPMRITAYTSATEETDDTPFITANGTTVHDGIAASNMLPFGTQIKIPALFGDKIFTIADRMSPKFYRTIDIWMADREKAIVFGVANAKIVVLGTSTYAQSPFETKDISANLH
jgi:3D (Asp-Asp-Asp) domain-containing protein